MQTRSSRLRNASALVGVGVWLLALLAGIAMALLIDSTRVTACDLHPQSYNFGRFSWSLIPPGPRCTWTVKANGVSRTSGPGWPWSAYVTIMTGAGLLLAIELHRLVTEQ